MKVLIVGAGPTGLTTGVELAVKGLTLKSSIDSRQVPNYLAQWVSLPVVYDCLNRPVSLPS